MLPLLDENFSGGVEMVKGSQDSVSDRISSVLVTEMYKVQ
jgi:hypothetical protein